MSKWNDNLMHEIKFGGKESPCPFCKLPRCRRSDHIRCSACGINWIAGLDDEWMDKDPRPGRMQKYLDSIAQVPVKKREEK